MKKNVLVVSSSLLYYLLITSTLIYTLSGNLPELVGTSFPSWYNKFVYITFLVYAVGFFFILRMKRPALVIMTVVTVILHTLNFVIGIFSQVSLVIDVLIFGMLWTQYRHMVWS